MESRKVIDTLLMVEKVVRGEICYSINRYTKANNKYMRDYNKKQKMILKKS